MANTKITSLTELTESPASTDMFPFVDVSDATMAATGTTKKLAGSRIVFQDSGTASLTTLNATNITGATLKASNASTGTISIVQPSSTVPTIDLIAGGGSRLSIRATDVTTDATTKRMRFATRHATNSEEDVLLAFAENTTAANLIVIGGSSSVFNAATQVSFMAAANHATVTGTEMLRINSGTIMINGVPLFGGTASGGTLTLQSTTHATKGKILLGASSAYDGANVRLGIGTLSPASQIDVVGTVQMDVLKLDQTPTASVQVQSHYVTMNFNGTDYKVLLAA